MTKGASAWGMLAVAILVGGSPFTVAHASQSDGENSPSACAWMMRMAGTRDPLMADEGAVYEGMANGLYETIVFRFAALTPHLGVLVRQGGPAGLVVSWPASLPFGPVTACRMTRSGRGFERFRSLRLVLEPGFVVSSEASVFLRPGIRYVWHRSAWPIGLGAGVGSTLALSGHYHGAASVSPELLLHYGNCCGAGYILFAARVDYFPAQRDRTAVVGNVGIAFW